MNLCIFTGRLTRDPEVRSINGSDGKPTNVISFSIAINNRRTNKTSFPNLEAWGQTADAIAKWFKQGDPITVQCEHMTDSWTDATTQQKRSRDKFRVNGFEFLPTNNKERGNENEPEPREKKKAVTVPVEEEDEDIPF